MNNGKGKGKELDYHTFFITFHITFVITSQPLAAAEGYVPDSYVTSDLVTTGRPAPSMIYLNMVNMDVFPAQAVVKCDDTTSGIVAGLHAGCWTVGIAKTVQIWPISRQLFDPHFSQGNYVGMNEAEMEKCDKNVLSNKIQNAREILYKVIIFLVS